MSNPGEVDEPRTAEAPTGEAIAPMTRRSSGAGWWVSAVVASIAALGLFVILKTEDRQDALAAAREQAAMEARLDRAAADAQRAAVQASRSAQAAMDSNARATRRAAEAAQTAANQAARNAAATAPATPQP